MRRILRPANAALCVLGVLAVALLVLAIQRQNAPPPASNLPPAAASTPRASVAFIGDSLASGTPDGGLGPANWTSLLGARNGWVVTDAAVDGAGYVAAPPGGGPFSTQVDRVARARPTLVVVTGARPDAGQGRRAVRDAATALFQQLRTALPQASIVVIGPVWPGGDAPADVVAVRDSVRDATAQARLPFVDPIEARWFNGTDADGVAPGGQNLNDRGHQRVAELVGDALRGAGVTP